jgi:hypothetical protein
MNKITEEIGTGKPGPGRPKGSLNKTTAAIKDMVTQALEEAGGVDYLIGQASSNPTAFLTLVGKVIPLQVAGSLDHQVKVSGSLAWKPPQ